MVENGWKRCGTKGCGQPLPESGSENAPALADWWARVSETEAFASRREAVERTAIGKGDLGPFVTSLVERLSEMGTDTLQQRFGDGDRGHLARLHELARFDIDDEQVQEDTRRAFSVNRLVRAWLPTGGAAGDEGKAAADIREAVGFVLRRTPWKFALWRAVVRAAVRRPFGEAVEEADVTGEAEAGCRTSFGALPTARTWRMRRHGSRHGRSRRSTRNMGRSATVDGESSTFRSIEGSAGA